MENNYEQKYKKALDNARLMFDAGNNDVKHIVGQLFPELAESEDEKIRREIINYFKCQTRDEPSRKDIHNKWISWRERQEGCEVIKKDWLEHIKQSWYKEGFIDGKYAEKRCLEWTQNDATILNELIDFLENKTVKLQHDLALYASWLKRKFYPSEKQAEQKPDYCHHEVDLSNCSEEYRKAYYDGWNNCNMQYSQCKSESNDVVKCLINGMKFYYEDNEEATWGTEKFSMKVKDILAWLENIPYTIDHEKREGFHLGYKAGLERLEMKTAEESLGVDSDTYNKIIDECIFGEQKPNDKVEPRFKVKYAGSEYNVLEVKDIAGVTFYGIEDEPNHIDYVKAENCEIISGYAIKENGSPYPTKPAVFSKKKPAAWSEEDGMILSLIVNSLRFIRDTLSHDDKYTVDVGSFESQIEWLQSLQDRVQPQPKQEWSEEDEKIFRTILSDGIRGAELDMLQVNWLKSLKGRLKPQNRWKPSELQLGRREANGSYPCWHTPNEGVDVELINCPKNENSSN